MRNFKMIAAIVFCLSFYSVQAGIYDSMEKFYVAEDAIELTDDAIFVHLDQHLIEVNELFEDDQGVYFLNVMRTTKTCPRCGEYAMVDGKCMMCQYREN